MAQGIRTLVYLLICMGPAGLLWSQGPEEPVVLKTELRIASVVRAQPLWVAQFMEDAVEEGDYTYIWKPLPIRTSGASPVFSYFGPKDLILATSADGSEGRVFYPEKRLLDADQQLVAIVSKSPRGAEQNEPNVVFLLSLDRLGSSGGELIVFNATNATLLGTLAQEGQSDFEIDLSPGLSTGIPIGLQGALGFQFHFGDAGMRWVFGDRFRRQNQENLLLFLSPPRIRGSRSLMGHWVRLR